MVKTNVTRSLRNQPIPIREPNSNITGIFRVKLTELAAFLYFDRNCSGRCNFSGGDDEYYDKSLNAIPGSYNIIIIIIYSFTITLDLYTIGV